MSRKHIDYMLPKIPRRRFPKVDAAAAVIRRLASPGNSPITGAVWDLSGGQAIHEASRDIAGTEKVTKLSHYETPGSERPGLVDGLGMQEQEVRREAGPS
ncbi:hypothetical protein [Hasllibacter halocynthiae]|uniref:hypothetical protein n=1 Tax=Hasllibacter halocynthiae TaxID=595589 RepID=UPI000D07E3EF|nr:hypothetical protein [Hasllibacter halocynthiae]